MFANYAYKVYISIHNAAVQNRVCLRRLRKKNKCETLPTPAKLLPGVRWRAAAFSLLAVEKPKTLYARKVAFMEVEHTALHLVHKKSPL
jgi:hypothetical protein